MSMGFVNLGPQAQDGINILLAKILKAGAGGSPGAGGTGLTSGNYGGGAPSFTPTSGSLSIAMDTSNGEVWFYSGGPWLDSGMAVT